MMTKLLLGTGNNILIRYFYLILFACICCVRILWMYQIFITSGSLFAPATCFGRQYITQYQIIKLSHQKSRRNCRKTPQIQNRTRQGQVTKICKTVKIEGTTLVFIFIAAARNVAVICLSQSARRKETYKSDEQPGIETRRRVNNSFHKSF